MIPFCCDASGNVQESETKSVPISFATRFLGGPVGAGKVSKVHTS